MKSLKGTTNVTMPQEAYAMITEMLHIDNRFDDLPTVDRLKQRQLILTGKVDAYFACVKMKYTPVAHNSTIGKTLAYSIHQKSYLRTFLNDGDVPMDNNYAEQAIRPFAIGRKNYILTHFHSVPNFVTIVSSLESTCKNRVSAAGAEKVSK